MVTECTKNGKSVVEDPDETSTLKWDGKDMKEKWKKNENNKNNDSINNNENKKWWY